MEYSAFRLLVKNSFPDLICSVLMYEKGSGTGGEVTMYRAKVKGMPIGDKEFSTESAMPQDVIDELIRQVAPERRARKAQRVNRMIARNGGSTLTASRGGEATHAGSTGSASDVLGLAA